ncbi:MAG: 50S ribosomal protein L17 [SAR324 cluster bacterium]|nr:50S ribosomal protein L17 [SAR324 cluster bacterium]
MRHLKAGNRLGVTTAHRRAMMRNMVTSILEIGQITCTLARAKEVRKPLEKMISWAKQGDLHARRQALRFVKSKEAMSQLFEELAERYKDRNGGYSRIIKLGKNRLGDNSEMAIIQLLGSEADRLSDLKSQSGKKKKPKKKESTILKEVSEEVRTESTTPEEQEVDPEKNESDETAETAEVQVETTRDEHEVETKDEIAAEVAPEQSDTEVTPEVIEVPEETASAETEMETKDEIAAEAVPDQSDVEETPEVIEVPEETAPAETKVETEAAVPDEVVPVQNDAKVILEQAVHEEIDSEKKTSD